MKVNVIFVVQSRPADAPEIDWVEKNARKINSVLIDDNAYIQFDQSLRACLSLIEGCQMLSEEFVDAGREMFTNRFDWEYVKSDVFARAMRSLQMPVDRMIAFKEEFTDEGPVTYRFRIIIEEQ